MMWSCVGFASNPLSLSFRHTFHALMSVEQSLGGSNMIYRLTEHLCTDHQAITALFIQSQLDDGRHIGSLELIPRLATKSLGMRLAHRVSFQVGARERMACKCVMDSVQSLTTTNCIQLICLKNHNNTMTSVWVENIGLVAAGSAGPGPMVLIKNKLTWRRSMNNLVCNSIPLR